MTIKVDTKFKREAERGSHDHAQACNILDAGKLCHVGFTLDGQPYVLPMAYARRDEELLIHGSVASRLMKNLASGLRCCVTVTHFDGMVYARSTFYSSMNYRSVMVFGMARLVTGIDEKKTSIQVLIDHLMPGRHTDVRDSTRKELNATSLLSLPIETFSVKQRTGPPEDLKADLSTPIWAGVVPARQVNGEPVDAPDLLPDVGRPDYL
jgi:hypothetical protein